MSQFLLKKSLVEMNMQKQLHSHVMRVIRKRNMTNESLAKRLDLLPSGVHALMERRYWPIETALRVAECLKIDMNLKLKSND